MTLKNLLGISLDAVAAECLVSAQALQTHVLAWLKANRPGLLAG